MKARSSRIESTTKRSCSTLYHAHPIIQCVFCLMFKHYSLIDWCYNRTFFMVRLWCLFIDNSSYEIQLECLMFYFHDEIPWDTMSFNYRRKNYETPGRNTWISNILDWQGSGVVLQSWFDGKLRPSNFHLVLTFKKNKGQPFSLLKLSEGYRAYKKSWLTTTFGKFYYLLPEINYHKAFIRFRITRSVVSWCYRPFFFASESFG